MSSLHRIIVAYGLLCWSILPSLAQTTYDQPCPVYGLGYPKVPSYGSSEVFVTAMQNLRGSLGDFLSNSSTDSLFNHTTTAFSMDVYSLQDEQPLFTYHYTPDALKSLHSVGVETVDSNTVYRIGSVSKLFTVYIYLIAAGDATWNQPITKFIPELALYMEEAQDTVNRVDWDSITIGALASQLAGIGRDAAYSPVLENAIGSLGLPAPPEEAIATCGDDSRLRIPCNRTAFFDEYLLQHPVVASFTTPIYSNAAYQILAYAVENMTGIAMPDLFETAFVKPLGLNSTFYTVPPYMNTSFIPINATSSWWNADALGESPAGGYYSSINDMRAIGKSMLNSTLLNPAQTRRWMKPHSFTADVNYTVGAPWEILRAPVEPLSWMYTKSGDLGAYSAMIVLLPEYDVGFSVLAAGSDPTNAVRVLSDMTAAYTAPALQSAAQASAASTYAGTYTDPKTNSTLTLVAADTGYGLQLTNWIFDGHDLLSILASVYGAKPDGPSLVVHLYYTGLQSNNGTTSWRAVYEALPQPRDSGAFSTNCISWLKVDAITYGGVGLDEFLFTLDVNGSGAVSVEPRVLGEDYVKAKTGGTVPRRMQRVG